MQILEPPYYAVIFTSKKSRDQAGYPAAAERMQALCDQQPGFLHMVHATTDEGYSVTTCYWQDLEAIAAWKANREHAAAQAQGIEQWYDLYHIEVARIEKAYSWFRHLQ